MNANDILLLGVKHSVTAVSRSDGQIIWRTSLPSGAMGDGFVTLLADRSQVFAYSGGQLHCLDLLSGRLLWSNKLTGYGFGLASLCLPGGASAPDAATLHARQAAERNNAAATVTVVAAT